MIRAVLFDLDDTLVDWIGPAHDALEEVRAEHEALGAHPAEALHEEHLRVVEETYYSIAGGASTPEELRAERMRRLVAFAGGHASDEEARRLGQRFREAYLAARRPVRGAPALLETLRGRGLPIVIVTNNLVAEQEDKLTATGLRQLVDAMVISEAEGVSKPEPRIFEIALARARCRAHETVMVGDSWRNDVRGALGVGIAAVWLNRLGAPRPDDAPARELRSLEPTRAVVELLLSSAA